MTDYIPREAVLKTNHDPGYQPYVISANEPSGIVITEEELDIILSFNNKLLEENADTSRINNTLGKMAHYLASHNSICVSVSGGADSDVIVHVIATYFREHLHKIHFVFANTGIEYRATLEHLDYLRSHYDIEIDEVRGMPIPVAVKKYGIPFLSKQTSEYLGRLIKHGFLYEDATLPALLTKYPKCKVGLRWWTNDWGDKSRFNIRWNAYLKEFLLLEQPRCQFSAECCYVSKKKPIMRYQKEKKCDLYITGERKAEGGGEPDGTAIALKNHTALTTICRCGFGITIPSNTMSTKNTLSTLIVTLCTA